MPSLVHEAPLVVLREAPTLVPALLHGFVPLVLGPASIPRLTMQQARRDPWLAVLAALTHGNRPGGTAVALAAFEALDALDDPAATVCYDLIRASLNEVARRALEAMMQPGKYEYQSDFARRYVREGREEGRRETIAVLLALVDRYGAVGDELRRRVGDCAAPDVLRALALDLANATDRAAVEQVLARLPAADG